MRAVVQRVEKAEVKISGESVGKIGKGSVILLGVEEGDSEEDMKYLADKMIGLRIFEDDNGKMNLSLSDISAEALIISQFTLLGDCRKGRRPSFDKASEPKRAKELYEKMCVYFKERGIHTETGVFGADMKVSLINDGPVTLLIDSKKLF